jgi:hypothetical protein
MPAGAVLVLEIGDQPPFPYRMLAGTAAATERMTELLLDGKQRLGPRLRNGMAVRLMADLPILGPATDKRAQLVARNSYGGAAADLERV